MKHYHECCRSLIIVYAVNEGGIDKSLQVCQMLVDHLCHVTVLLQVVDVTRHKRTVNVRPSELVQRLYIERTVYDAMVTALKECRKVLATALCRLSYNSCQGWIDNHSAQGILRRSQRSMATLRADGKIGYTLIEGKVFLSCRRDW